MDPNALDDLRSLQLKSRTSRLDGDELTRYRAAADRLLATALAQQGNARGGSERRRLVRLARTVAVELTWPGGRARSVTLDLGMGGFSVVLASPPPFDAPLAAFLEVRRGHVIRSAVRVTNVARSRGSVRVSLAMTDIPDTDRARLDAYVVEQLLPQFRAGCAAREPAAHGAISERALQRAG